MGVGFGFSRPIECGAIASLSICMYGAFAPLCLARVVGYLWLYNRFSQKPQSHSFYDLENARPSNSHLAVCLIFGDWVMHIFLWALVFLLAGLDIFLFFKNAEYAYCAFISHQPPFVPSNKYLRRAASDVICNYYPDTKLVCEIGSGFGGLARFVARRCNCDVIALENMPFSACVSWCCDFFCRHSRTIRCDALAYMKNTDKHFDIAVAYLGPKLTPVLSEYKDKFSVLITLDFEIPEIRPTRIIDVGHGMTRYNGVLYPHRLFVYEFRKLV